MTHRQPAPKTHMPHVLSNRQSMGITGVFQPSSGAAEVPQAQWPPPTGGAKVYRRMLVPLDGSELAEVVLAYATELSGRLGLRVTFLRVCTPDEVDLVPACQAYVQQVGESLKRQWRDRARMPSGRPQQEAPSAEGHVAVGHPADEILRYAENNDIDVTLMATHGRSGIKRWAMGSVAEKVLRVSKVPVWLVRAGVSEEIVHDKWPRKTILVPLDGSALAESVLPHVETLTRQRGTDLVDVVLLSVCEYDKISDGHGYDSPSGWEMSMRREIEVSKRAARRYLAQVRERLNNGSIRVRCEVLTGEPAKTIIDYANGYPFTLIAMATHGRSGLGRWAFGSVADRLLRGVTNPLFLVRPQQP